MFKYKKLIFGVMFCGLMASPLMAGLAHNTSKMNAVYAASSGEVGYEFYTDENFANPSEEMIKNGYIFEVINNNPYEVAITEMPYDGNIKELVLPSTVSDGNHDYTITETGHNLNICMSSLTKLTFSEGMRVFEELTTCWGTMSLKDIIFPATLREVKSGAFQGEVSIKSITFNGTQPPIISSDSFDYNYESIKIYVPASAVNTYKNDPNWSKYVDNIEAIPLTVADVLPDDFPVFVDSIPDDVWANDNGIVMGLYEGRLISTTSDFTKQLSIIEDVSTTVLTKSGDNYLAGNEYIQITFNCVNDIATSIEIAGLSGSYADYSDFNGTYSEPKIKDSNKDLRVSISVRASIENGVITISGEEDGYRMELELYTYPENEMIPAGTYVISDSNEAGTALKSEGFKDDAPLKSYIALLDNDGNITDCWLLCEGTVSLSRGIVTVDATNSKGKPISVSATVYSYYTVTISVNDQTMGSINLTTIQDVRKDTPYYANDNVLCVGEEGIIATANEGYEFDCWKISETKVTENGTITADTTFTAVFKEVPATTYKVTITSTNGTVDIEELTGFVEGTQYSVNGNKLTVGDTEITATANEGYEFDCWKIGETKVTENGTITADTIFTATFKVTEKPTPAPEDNGLSGGAIAGIIVGAVAAVALISYAVMFVVYAKTGKGLKFLFKSFDWLKKLFKMK